MKKGKKAREERRNKKVKDLAANEAKAIAGGRKAGGAQENYLTIKLEDALVSSY